MGSTVEQDRRDILKIHKDWWEANCGLDIPRMASCFPKGMNYLMFNANAHPYFGLDEKIRLWEWYRNELEIPEIADIRIMKLDIRGDMAWLGCEGIFPMRPIGASGTGSVTWKVDETEVTRFLIRASEVYERDDGEGNPVWKMWHFHASPLPPADEPRPSIGDTVEQRGVGWNPWGEPLRVTGT